jgi:hypothetical protein
METEENEVRFLPGKAHADANANETKIDVVSCDEHELSEAAARHVP